MTIEDLKRCRRLKNEGEDLREWIERLQSAVESVTQRLSHTPGGGQDHDKLAQYLAKIDELRRRLLDKQVEWESLCFDVENTIDRLDPSKRQIMRLRYIHGLEWRDVAERACYSEARCYVLHADALCELGIFVKDNSSQ